MDLLASLTEECPNLRWVRYLENWKANSREDLFQFWNYIRENNIDLDSGETEWREVSFIFLTDSGLILNGRSLNEDTKEAI